MPQDPAASGPATGYTQVDRNLLEEFAGAIDSVDWDVAFLQECPPAWVGPLGRATGADGERGLTSRNWMSPITRPLAEHRPHRIGSWEGGANAILVRARGSRAGVLERRTVPLCRLPERRSMLFLTLSDDLCLANFHASTGRGRAERDVLEGARWATGLAGGRPLVFGGDFNCRPAGSDVYRQLDWEYGLTGSGDPKGIDHLLHSDQLESAGTGDLPDRLREPLDGVTGLRLRLSDHPMAVADFS